MGKTKTMLITGKRLKGKLSPDDKILSIATKTGEYLLKDRSLKLIGGILEEELNFNDHPVLMYGGLIWSSTTRENLRRVRA